MKNILTRVLLVGVLGLSISSAVAQISTIVTDEYESPIDCAVITKPLKLGSRDSRTNDEVTTLQVFLAQAGYLESDPTGYYGILTVKAVKAFQAANGIEQLGNVGPYTRATIKKVSCGNNGVQTVPVTPVSNVPAQSFSLLSNPTFKLSYDSYKKESSLVASFNVKIAAKDTAIIISKPGYGVLSGSHYFSIKLQKDINYFGKTDILAFGAVDNGSYYTIPAGSSATFYITQTYEPKRMYAGSYSAVLSFFAYDPSGSIANPITSTNNVTDYVTVVGEDAVPAVPAQSFSLLSNPTFKLSYDSYKKESSLVASFNVKIAAKDTAIIISKPGYGVLSGSHYFSIKLQKDINYFGKTDILAFGAVDNGSYYTIPAGSSATFYITQTYEPKRMYAGSYSAVLSFFAYDPSGSIANPITSTNNVTDYVTVVGEDAVAQSTTQACQLVDIYAVQVPGYVYNNLFIKISSPPDHVSATSEYGITGAESWDNLKFTEYQTGDGWKILKATQTLNSTGANYVTSRKKNIKVTLNNSPICMFPVETSSIGQIPAQVIKTVNTIGGVVSSNIFALSGLMSTTQKASAMECVDIERSIHRGDESKVTTKLQEFLVHKGLLSEKVTGFFGDMTISAVKAYQRSVGLPETGMVYDFTRKAIMEETCK